MKHVPLLAGLFCVIFGFTLLAGKALHYYWNDPLNSMTESRFYSVQSGTNLSTVVNDLTEEKIWAGPYLVRISLKIFEPEFVLKSGEYLLPAKSSPAKIFSILGSGVSFQYKMTLIEGDSASQMLVRFSRDFISDNSSDTDTANNLPSSSDSSTVTDSAFLSDLLSDAAKDHMQGMVNPEGWFFPDTYYYSKGSSVEDLLFRAQARMLEILNAEWDRREQNLPYRSAYQALIMASLIEKETAVAYERAQIAGVFVRRLQKGMRLQTDPSVIYGLGKKYSGNLRRSDLRSDTPYNTYTRKGLPPTPIAMPGREAINAALHPAQGDALYFVAKGDGSHYFSATLSEHQEAVRKYQVLQRRADYRSSPIPQQKQHKSSSQG